MDRSFSRRTFIKKHFFLHGGFLSMGMILPGCDQNNTARKENKSASPIDPCKDFSTVSDSDLEARKKLGYVEDSPIENMTCDKCKLWILPPTDSTCGGCLLFKGPVYPSGYCTYWAAPEG